MLQKQYKYLSDQHQYERAKARKAPEVGAKRSAKQAALKRKMTMTVKAVATAAAVAVGVAAVNKVLNNNNVTLNGKRVSLSAQNVSDIGKLIKTGKTIMGFFY